jgi:8-oxo-dGTP pyrophosphatase MutT (NUDIX family)
MSKENAVALVDYKANDYKGFIFVVHPSYGMLLLRCSRKKNKGVHYQLPGGHVDEPEFLRAALESNDRDTQLQIAGKAGAARELFEETGMDMRKQLDRVVPQPFQPENAKEDRLCNEFKHRLFYFLSVNDEDFLTSGMAPLEELGKHLKLKGSHEHTGWLFQPSPDEAVEMLEQHSGGKPSQVLKLTMTGGTTQWTPPTVRRTKRDKNDIPVHPSTGRSVPTPNKGDDLMRSLDIPPKKETKDPFCCFC